jgi:phage baseplate assembly protein W
MGTDVVAVIAALKTAFQSRDIKELFTKVYDYYFVPRNPSTRAVASAAVITALEVYETEQRLEQWIIDALAYKQKTGLSIVKDQIDPQMYITTVLSNNEKLILALNDPEEFWSQGIPLLWLLIFIETYGEFPKNVPGTPAHYVRGATDDRWEALLNSKSRHNGKTGYQALLDNLKERMKQNRHRSDFPKSKI